MRYFELIDDLGHDFYRVDDLDRVMTWDPAESVWYHGDISALSELRWIEASWHTSLFTEVTEGDVR